VVARRGDGILLRVRTYWLDCRINRQRYTKRLGKVISLTVARELAQVQRTKILRGEAGIGPATRADWGFDEAATEFLAWATAEKRPQTVQLYAACLKQLRRSFAGKRLSALAPFLIEKHKRQRLEADAPVMANRELAVLRALFNRARALGRYAGDNPVRPSSGYPRRGAASGSSSPTRRRRCWPRCRSRIGRSCSSGCTRACA